MILTRECLVIPESRDYSELILRYVESAEELLWKEQSKTEVSDDAKLVISYLLFVRMEELLSRRPFARYDNQPYFTDREPLLAGMAKDYADFIREMLENLHAMRGELSVLMGGAWSKVVKVLDCGGDLHNRGRCTLVVETDGGRFVYKPRDCGVDRWFMRFAGGFCSEYLYVPKVVAAGSCGLFEYVEGADADMGQAETYYRNLGRLCALARMLGSVDLHRENVIALGARIVPLDLETILAPRERREFFQRSVGKTYTPAEYERLQTSLRPSALLNPEVSGGRLGALYGGGENGSAPMDGEGQSSAASFLPQLEEGFAEEYRRIWENKALFAAELCSASDCRIRTVIRSTNQYDAMLDRLFSGSEEGAEEELLRQLREDTGPPLEAVCGYELAGLRRGDVPYFYTGADSVDICCDGETAVHGFFEMSAVAQALHRLETAGEEELAYELRLLRRSAGEDAI